MHILILGNRYPEQCPSRPSLAGCYAQGELTGALKELGYSSAMVYKF